MRSLRDPHVTRVLPPQSADPKLRDARCGPKARSPRLWLPPRVAYCTLMREGQLSWCREAVLGRGTQALGCSGGERTQTFTLSLRKSGKCSSCRCRWTSRGTKSARCVGEATITRHTRARGALKQAGRVTPHAVALSSTNELGRRMKPCGRARSCSKRCARRRARRLHLCRRGKGAGVALTHHLMRSPLRMPRALTPFCETMINAHSMPSKLLTRHTSAGRRRSSSSRSDKP